MTNDGTLVLISVLVGLAAGAFGVWVLVRSRLQECEVAKADKQSLAVTNRELEVRLETQTEAAEERLKMLREEMTQAFQAASVQAITENRKAFVDLAETRFEILKEHAKGDLDKREERIDRLVAPLKERLDELDLHNRNLEQARATSYELLTRQVGDLHKETATLARAMRDHGQRGKWGELSLERAFELAGMSEPKDFRRQQVFNSDDGRQIPDYIVSLPNRRQMVVDVKTPYDRYDEAVCSDDELERTRLFLEHARIVKSHIKALHQKDYPKHLPEALPFVIMFMPLESMLGEALRADPTLVDYGMSMRVALATPTTIVAMLSCIAYAWQQEEFARNCQQIQLESRKLYESLATAVVKVNSVSGKINALAKSQNELVSYIDNTVHRTAARVRDLKGGSDRVLEEPEGITMLAVTSARIVEPDSLGA